MINISFLAYFYGMGLFLYIFSVIIHELGHYSYAKVLKRKPYIRFDKGRLYTSYDGDTFTIPQHNKYILSGVLAGYIFLGLSAYIFPYWYIIALLYSFGCIKDITRLDLSWT